MHRSAIDAHGIANPSEKVPLLRIVKTTPIERVRWLLTGVVVVATGVIFLTAGANRTSMVEVLLLWSLVLLAI